MGNIKYENFLSNKISSLEKELNISFNKNVRFDKFYSSNYFEKEFFGLTYNNLFVIVGEDKKISSITLHSSVILSNNCYDLLVENYGIPTSILIIDEKKVVGESNTNGKGFNQNLKKKEMKLREGHFEEKPLYVIWDKQDYKIQILIKYKQETSEITFTKK